MLKIFHEPIDNTQNSQQMIDLATCYGRSVAKERQAIQLISDLASLPSICMYADRANQILDLLKPESYNVIMLLSLLSCSNSTEYLSPEARSFYNVHQCDNELSVLFAYLDIIEEVENSAVKELKRLVVLYKSGFMINRFKEQSSFSDFEQELISLRFPEVNSDKNQDLVKGKVA